MNTLRACQCPRARHRHGTRQAYSVDRCRCLPCRASNAKRRADYRAGHTFTREQLIDATSTRLRLRALAAVGVSRHEIAADLGISAREVQYLRNTRTVVQVGTAARVAEVYERRWNDWPQTRGAEIARAHAKRQGWAPPMALDDDELDVLHNQIIPDMPHIDYRSKNRQNVDEIAVKEAIAGRPVRLNRAEVSVATRTLTGMGYSARQIGERLRITERTVTRHRARGRAA